MYKIVDLLLAAARGAFIQHWVYACARGELGNLKGKSLTGQGVNCFRAVLWVLRGDNDYNLKELQLPNVSSLRAPCPWCTATGLADAPVGYHINEFRWANCMWRSNLTTAAQWFYPA